jgi:hypothetical protein
LPELLYRGGRLCDWIDITAPQQRAMLGLVFVATQQKPLRRHFFPAASSL